MMTKDQDFKQAIRDIFNQLLPGIGDALVENWPPPPDLADLIEWASPTQQKRLARLIAEIIANRDKHRGA
jgi:hypothetical protein